MSSTRRLFCISMCIVFIGQNVNSSPINNTLICDGEVGEILNHLRAIMNDPIVLNRNSIDAYIVPMNDAHQSEYIADHDKRLQYITKFTGSAGQAVVTKDRAALWTDSRYHLQAAQQLNSNCWQLMQEGKENVPRLSKWLLSVLPANSTIGVDPFLMTAKGFHEVQMELNAGKHEIVSISTNLIDIIWNDRPLPNKTQIIPLNIKYSGKMAGLKISEVMDKVRKENGESIIITSLDDIAWLLNLRGADVMYNPVFFSYVLLTPNNSYFVVDKSKLQQDAIYQLMQEDAKLEIYDYNDILDVIDKMINSTSGYIITSSHVSQAIFEHIPTNRHIYKNIVDAIKAIKNDVEVRNIENAHIRDGVALIKYLHWLNESIDTNNVTELSGAAKLAQFRAEQINFRGLSFEAISAVGEHTAMAHYSPTVETDKRITRNDIYMVDSGGQYWDGTTDVTRTLHFGTPLNEEKECYTRVLKGFIGVLISIVPVNTSINYLDYVARRHLWQAGLDYGHGTGHGVGMYLLVHEYPPLISQKAMEMLHENIITSNGIVHYMSHLEEKLLKLVFLPKPAFYKDNEFGIRIEDVIRVLKSDDHNAFNGRGALKFKSITYAPLQTNLIDVDLLDRAELNYINTYNKHVFDVIGPILLKFRNMDTYKWLMMETRPISF